ncbi:HRDC domain-containing protein, partial [Acinetobacter baumannii]|nr:HRDC domain-containing protein [Acinetobacter baumannii]
SALRAWRAKTAREAKVPAYVIFSDATLQAISEALPASEAELLDISGVGPSKLERYGAEVLQIIAALRS